MGRQAEHAIISTGGIRVILPSYIPAGLTNLQIPTNLYAEHVTQQYPLGTILEDDDRQWRYGRLSANACYRGRPVFDYDDPAEIGAYLGVQTAAATTFTWASVGAIVADSFAGGYVLLQGGFVRRIKGNTAASGAAVTVTFTLEDGETIPETAAANRYGIIKKNKYVSLISREVAAGQKAAHCVGVCTFDMTASYYGWFQTNGPCGVIGTPATLGDTMAEQALVANQVGSEVSVEAAYGYQVIGHCMLFDQIDWDNENFLIVDLCIDR